METPICSAVICVPTQEHVRKNLKEMGIAKINDAIIKKYIESPVEALKQLFTIFDEDGNGVLERDEITNMARTMKLGRSENSIQKEIKKMDKDGDGSISIDEFTEFMFKPKEKKEKKGPQAAMN
eukprot:SAG11_NODE_3707_length_2267_cov_2.191421_3_plen_124_part_00